jgi:hypothetical protein
VPFGEGLNVHMSLPLKSWYILHGCQVRPLENAYGPGAMLAVGSPMKNVRVLVFHIASSSRAPGSMDIFFLAAMENDVAVEFWSKDIVFLERIGTEFAER